MSLAWHQHLYFDPKTSDPKIYCNGKQVSFTKEISRQVNVWAVKHTNLKKETHPFFLFNGSHNIDFSGLRRQDIDNIRHHKPKFYFFEPLTYYVKNHKGFSDHILRLEKYQEDIRSYELDSVIEFTKKYKIDNFTVYVPDRYSETHFQKVYNINIKWYDPYLHAEITRLNTLQRFVPHQLQPTIKHKFWFGNWRYDPARHYAMCDLVSKNLHRDNVFSWYYYVSETDFCNNSWTDNIPSNMFDGLKFLNSNKPLNIDCNLTELVPFQNLYPGPNVVKDTGKFYRECFCALVSETRIAQPWVNLSEKTLFAIRNMRPFMLYAAPYSLKFIKELGLKTFSDYWDESYDNIEVTSERILAVNKQVEKINSLSIKDLNFMYKDMYPILKHNCQIIKKIL